MIERLSKNRSVKLSQTTGGQRELIREMRNKLNEIVDAVNDHEDLLYSGPGDDDYDVDEVEAMFNSNDDLCPDCRAELAAQDCDCDDDDCDEVIPAGITLAHDLLAFVENNPDMDFWTCFNAWSEKKRITMRTEIKH